MYSLIRKWEASGMKQEQFFQQNQISKSTFRYWRKKFLKEKGSVWKQESFIPVKITNNDFSDNDSEVLELVYPNGVHLELPASIDLSRLKPLIIL